MKIGRVLLTVIYQYNLSIYHVGETFPRKDLLNDTFILKYYPDWTMKKKEEEKK